MTDWSIPAHAGEPKAVANLLADGGVYPRPRGGTFADDALADLIEGLSPPTRGNLDRRHR